MMRRITILGMGPTASDRCRDMAKYVEGTEVWGLNNGYLKFPELVQARAFTRWYELHAWDYLKNWDAGQLDNGKHVDHFDHLSALDIPVYTGQKIPVVMTQEHLDWRGLFGHFHEQFEQIENDRIGCYFLGSPSVMLAHALWEHDQGQEIEYIQSYGIDTSDPSHGQQRTSWAFWTAQALARGIRLGGTMCDFMLEYERDAGLNGLREQITDELKNLPKTGPDTDVVIASFGTQEYNDGLDRLTEQAESFGLAHHIVRMEPPEELAGKERALWICAQKPRVIREALQRGKTVVYIDADDELLRAPGFEPGWEIGVYANPEKCETHLQVASNIVARPGAAAEDWLNQWEQFCGATNDHRANNMVYTMKSGHPGITDVTPYMRGVIQINPSRHRPITSTT